jgi:predicted SAM-dependent methyltransferase
MMSAVQQLLCQQDSRISGAARDEYFHVVSDHYKLTGSESMPVRLHLGCGERFLPGFIHVDARKFDHVDHVSAIDSLTMFADDSVDLIYHCALLEHVGRWDTVRVLSEWNRVLKPGGLLRSSVPNFEAIVTAYRKFNDVSKLLGMLYGGQNYGENLHYTMFDRRYYAELLAQAGFENMRDYDWREFLPQGYDDFSRAYLPHMDFDNGIQMMLNVDANKRSG